MLKGLFFCLPSVSVDKTLTPVIDELCQGDYEIIYYNTAGFKPAGPHPFQFISYPESFSGYYSDRIDEHTSYFQFGEILIDSAIGLMDFLLAEAERERPDFIIHSHLAIWGKLLAKYCKLPSVTLYTTFVLDKRIMLPYLRTINSTQGAGLDHVQAAIGYYRKCAALYSRLTLQEKPDPWDAYVNAGDLNLSFILAAFQPQKKLFGMEYAFPGYPFPFVQEAPRENIIYVAMGTILNKDIELYKICIAVLGSFPGRVVLSVGSKVDLAALGPIPDHIGIRAFVDQRAMLQETALFITRGGMASVHESIHCLTPMIVIPVIPEQQITAGRIQELGIGIVIPPAEVSRESLMTAIGQILSKRQDFVKNIKALVKDEMAGSAAARARMMMDGFFSDRSPAGSTVVDLFAAQAGRVPGMTALQFREQRLTYQELHEKTDRLAQCLQKSGIRNGATAAVVMGPCIEIMVAIFGILKAGGSYVPIDPEYPPERVAYMLTDSACNVILSTRDALSQCPLEGDRTLILLDEPLRMPEMEKVQAGRLPPAAADLAYIIYTSGSTGNPKGVMVEHGQLYRYIMDVYARLELEDCRSYAILGTFSADAGLTAIFAALCFGRTLHILDIRSFTSLQRLIRYFTENQIDCYKVTPSLISQLLQHAGGQMLLPRKRLILGGEACPWSLANRIYPLLPQNCRLFNHYGPTETTVGVTTYTFPERQQDLPAVIPLGKALPSVTAHILSPDGGYVSGGEAGELYIEGALIARGYLNNQELTRQRFPDNVFAGKKTRLYRTGDLVRCLPDGNLEYLGRMDDQVKISGHRIELKEVEAVIFSSGLVKECLVLAKENAGGFQYLAAYVQPAAHYEKDLLVQYVRRKLPSFMIPGSWVALHEWPLTLNNKIDRLALPDAEPEKPAAPGILPAPDAGILPILTDIWMKILGLPGIGLHDDFFELGGNSLQLLQMSFAINDRLHTEISAAALFAYPTIESLAVLLAGRTSEVRVEARTVPNGSDACEASLAQRNLFLQNRIHPLDAFPNASLSYEIMGTLDLSCLGKAVAALIQRNESLRTSYHFQKGRLCLQAADDIEFRLDLIDCRSDDIDQEIREAVRPFDLGKAPLIRVLIMELRNTRKYLHLYMPHINSDGESLKLIMKDLAALYHHGIAEERLQAGYFQRESRRYLHSSAYQDDEAFWMQQIRRDIPLLPFGFPVQRENTRGHAEGVSAVIPFPEGLTLGVHHYVKGKSITKFQLGFISFFLLLCKTSAVNDLTVLAPVHGRNKKGFDSIIGLLANVIAVRCIVDPALPLANFIEVCKQSIVQAIRHQQYPFELLQQAWTKKGRKPKNLRQSFFGYHDHREEYSFGEASLRLHIPERNKENLPLSAALFETNAGMTISLSSAAAGFTGADLRALAALYFYILSRLIDGDGSEATGSFLQKAGLPSPISSSK